MVGVLNGFCIYWKFNMTDKHIARIKHRMSVWVKNGASSGASYDHIDGGYVIMNILSEKHILLLHICDPDIITDTAAPWWTRVPHTSSFAWKCSLCKQIAPNNIRAIVSLRVLEI